MSTRDPFAKVIAFLCALSAGPPVADAACPTSFDFISVAPSPRASQSARSFQAWFECYDPRTGDAGNCQFTYRVTGIEDPASEMENNAGHVEHSGNRPLVLEDDRNPQGKVVFAADTDPGALSVAGSTLATPPFRGARVTHPTPEVSGRLAIAATLTAPPGSFFCSFTEAGRVQPIHFTADVRIPNLELLPATGTDHEVVRGGTATHPEGTFATPQTIATLLKVAEEYRRLSGSKLSVNDLSLPAGGLFDFRNDWLVPHKSHREGADADINRTNIAGIQLDCLEDEALRKAIETVAAGARLPKGRCESGGRKHIDF